ncbi:hypothetical protein DXG03_005025 [Asterophora parasitica]|uniref:DNA-directed RNA polymerase III subunit RPC3 n=1 Tax=Asterophora parasitica TaxID=117018 RepID=A0A9P7G9B1_9AGAR|nr:hypothetical protein DXG03_005025 [Asterophora parasitica]
MSSILETFDSQMLDYQNDADFSMHLSSSDMWFQDETAMEDDGLEPDLTIEVDMEHYDETQNTEYEMEDGSEIQDDIVEIQDVEVYDAFRPHSPDTDAYHGHEASVGPLNDSADVHIAAELLEPSPYTTHSPTILTEANSFETFTPEVPPPAGTPQPQTPTVPADGNSVAHAPAAMDHPPHPEGLELGLKAVTDDLVDQEESLSGEHSGTTQRHPSVAHDLGASDEAVKSHSIHLPSAEPLEQQSSSHGIDHQTGSPEFDSSAASTGDPHEISEGVYIDPPPAVLISVSSDAPSISLFNAPSKSRLVTPSNGESELGLVVLLAHQPTLYYEPLSSVFEALRQDEYLRSVSDVNGELLFDAYDLELMMSEDYTFAHELTLHDLNVLHDGLNKTGPLRLRLRTVTPRFIDRYHMLQEQIAHFQLANHKDIAVEPSTEDVQDEDTSCDTHQQLELEQDRDAEEQDQLPELPDDDEHPGHENPELQAQENRREDTVHEDPQEQDEKVVEGEQEELEHVYISKAIGDISQEESITHAVGADRVPEASDPDVLEAERGDEDVEYEQHGEEYGEEYPVHEDDDQHVGDGETHGEASHDPATEDGSDVSIAPLEEYMPPADEEKMQPLDSAHTNEASEAETAQFNDDYHDLQEVYGEPGSVTTTLDDLPGSELDVITNVDGEPDLPGSSADATLAAVAPELQDTGDASYDLDTWDDTLDGEGELDVAWEAEAHAHETASNLSSVTLSSQPSTKRSISEVELEEFEDDEGLQRSSPASALLTRGRLPLPQLVRITGHKPRTALASILVLVQHNLLWHARTDEDGEVLEVNVEECLLRLRFGRVVWQTEELFGKAASDIVQTVLDHGKLCPPDILYNLGAYDPKTIMLYTHAIRKLVSTSYLKPSTILSHVSPRDKRIQYEAEEKAKIAGFPTAREVREAKEVAEARLKREEEEAEQVGLKRKGKETTGHRPSKRKTVEEDEHVVEDTVHFRVNFDKFNVHIRNSLMVKAAKERYNAGAALVLQAALKVTESSQKSVAEIRSDPMSVANIVLQLSESDDLSSGLVFSSKKPSTSACIKDYLGMLSSADNPTPAGRAGSFVSYSSSKVLVEFEVVGRRLRRRVLESMARERHGVEGVRILRLLLDTGKMDEKQISKAVMMAPKDVRPLLAALAADSLISTQEVPKSADRNPTRTFYLWFAVSLRLMLMCVDLHKAYSVILGNLYKTLYNVGMRRRAEEEASEVKAVLEKRERSDVSQDESLLSRLERDIVKEWEGKQKRLTVLEMRVEETVFILKDLGVLGINDD